MATYTERVDQGQSRGPSMTTVVNITKCKDFNAKRGRDDDDPTRNPGDVYIGRYHWDPKHGLYQKSDWHNPYRASLRTKGGRVAEKRDGTRAEVVEEYGQYILGKPGRTFLGTKPRTPPNILKRIPELKGKRLGCWCTPDDCHGDLLAKWADEGIPSDWGAIMEVVSEFPVDVEWPNNHRGVILTTGYPQNSSGIPVLVFDGQPHGAADLMPGTKIKAIWRKGRMGPVWTLLQKAIDAGYPIEVDTVG